MSENNEIEELISLNRQLLELIVGGIEYPPYAFEKLKAKDPNAENVEVWEEMRSHILAQMDGIYRAIGLTARINHDLKHQLVKMELQSRRINERYNIPL
jgi:hypothetical protein